MGRDNAIELLEDNKDFNFLSLTGDSARALCVDERDILQR